MNIVRVLLSVHRERGQTLAEYSILLTLVAVGVTAAALMFFSGAVAGLFESVTACFDGGC